MNEGKERVNKVMFDKFETTGDDIMSAFLKVTKKEPHSMLFEKMPLMSLAITMMMVDVVEELMKVGDADE